MSERVRNLIAILAMSAMAIVLVTLIATNPTDRDRVQAIGAQIKCPVCQGESIATSPASMARDMMSLVAERVAAGANDQAIIDELLSSYSGAVLLDPPARGATLVLWLAPLGALVVGLAVIAWWRRHPGASQSKHPVEATRSRRMVPLLILGVALAVIVVVAAAFVKDGAGPAEGVAALPETGLENVSNETMEAVIAANLDNPQINGMRLALAERYFETGDYSDAFPHYLEVARSPDATSSQAVTALIRLGWMAWDGNAEADTAIELFDQALAIDPASSTALYLKGQVMWCGRDDTEAASELIGRALANPDLSSDARATLEDDLAAVQAGTSCR